jgi:hypothetical protein
MLRNLLRGALGLSVLLSAACAVGGVTRPMALPELADHAGQVIVGEIVASRSYWAEDPKRIETELTLAKVRYLKGRHGEADDAFRLVVPGGTVGEVTMRIGCTPGFEVGQTWVLFLLPEYKTYPTVGVGQGAFRVVADEGGVARVYTAERAPVAGIDARRRVRLGTVRRGGASKLVSANGVRVRGGPQAREKAARAMRLADFERALEPVLAGSRDHEMTEPAGRRVLVAPTPVALEGGEAAATGDEGKRPAVVEVKRRTTPRDQRERSTP